MNDRTDNLTHEQEKHDTGNGFSIYQLKREGDAARLSFLSYGHVTATGAIVTQENYELIYTAQLEPEMNLEDIFTRFNCDIPSDFTGHSLSVSDVVVVHQDGAEKAFYCDSFGFRETESFFQDAKAAEISAAIEAEPDLER